ncbi:MAG: peptide chain release factor N(5)-glutamine methyltransferase [Holophagales bacterium]|nr:peptide chain release factor N(5)-glutamine methyltransferase [Holophagales bacterium]
MSHQDFKSARKALAKRLSIFLPDTEADAESWRWFEEGLGWGRARIIAYGEELVSWDLENQIDAWFNRRKDGEPWVYILGWIMWRGRRFNVTPETLIPRPETELVFESAVQLATLIGARHAVDVGTGTGILGITLALDTSLDVTATDISKEALSVARQNAQCLNVKLNWACGNLLEPVNDPIELVVSNPPYIDLEDEATLQRELFFEPRSALFASDHGMEVVTKLIKQSIDRNAKGLVVEIGSGQGDELRSRAACMGWQTVDIRQDTAKHDRVLIARR